MSHQVGFLIPKEKSCPSLVVESVMQTLKNQNASGRWKVQASTTKPQATPWPNVWKREGEKERDNRQVEDDRLCIMSFYFKTLSFIYPYLLQLIECSMYSLKVPSPNQISLVSLALSISTLLKMHTFFFWFSSMLNM